MVRTKWALDNTTLADAYNIRRTVFIDEQGISEADEFDGSDAEAITLIVYDGKVPVATGRYSVIDGMGYLSRIAVIKDSRGLGYGDLIVRVLMRKLFDLGFSEQYIHAQTHAAPFYERIGFERYGDTFMEAGIPHCYMVHRGDVTGTCQG